MNPNSDARRLSDARDEPPLRAKPRSEPLVVAIDMGYGHLRAAWALAHAAGTDVLESDRPPLADAAEQARWRNARGCYEALSRGTSLPFVGEAFRRTLEFVTDIPKMRGGADLRPPNAAARMLARMAEQGLGRGLVETLRSSGRPLLATFYAPAIVAADSGIERVALVVTDVDVNRVWVPQDPRRSRITYCVPAERTAERLRRYGVPDDQVVLTGFPLPLGLLGDESLGVARTNVASRLARLDRAGTFRRAAAAELAAGGVDATVADDRPPLVVIAVGGAGAQVDAAAEVVAALAGGVVAGRWRVALVAGTRAGVAAEFRAELVRLGLSRHLGAAIEILFEPTLAAYLASFEELLARADVVWTKPSELSFYAALGLPLLLARPLGVHEKTNRRWLLERGAAVDARSGDAALLALDGGLRDGSLAATAWNGFTRLPKHGTWRILDLAR